MDDEREAEPQTTNALEHMSAIARDLVFDEENQRLIGDPALEYDPDLDKLHISDPFFAFQLRWSLRHRNGD